MTLNLVQSSWTFCANQGEQCDFDGTRQVRFTLYKRDYVATFRDGVRCDPSNFGARTRRSGSHGNGRCYVETTSSTEQGAAGSAAPDGVEVPSMPDDSAQGSAGMLPSMPQDSADAAGSSAPPSYDVAAGNGSGGGSGPDVDVSAIPEGDPGSSEVRIAPTSEQPAASDGTGAFRNECTFAGMNFDDAIVFPGKPGASHLHAYFGNTAVDAFTTADSIRNSGNSTCRGGIANRTGYWVPALLDPQGRPVKPKALEVYYKSGYNGIRPNEIQPFPEGLRMVAGNAKASSPQRVAYWGCHGHYIGKPGSIPNCPGGDALEMTVEFPQCWDGVNLDSPDHKSHMAYPSNGRCPASHPVPIPAITFNVLYPIPSGGTAGYRLVSDKYDASLPGGMSGHGDWFDGWDPDVVKTFVAHCIHPAVDCHSHLLGDGRRIY